MIARLRFLWLCCLWASIGNVDRRRAAALTKTQHTWNDTVQDRLAGTLLGTAVGLPAEACHRVGVNACCPAPGVTGFCVDAA
ncbi:MAG: hypothetical protein NTY19_25450 [Planctomycetota bacterium]|nr:hypothetical protein [Planctomycetota bacterium]